MSLWFSLSCLMAQNDCCSSRHHIHIQDKKKGEGGNFVKNGKASHKSLQKTLAFTSWAKMGSPSLPWLQETAKACTWPVAFIVEDGKGARNLKQIPAGLRRASPGTRPGFGPGTQAEEAMPPGCEEIVQESSAGKMPTVTSVCAPGVGVSLHLWEAGTIARRPGRVWTHRRREAQGLGRETDTAQHEQRCQGRVWETSQNPSHGRSRWSFILVFEKATWQLQK